MTVTETARWLLAHDNYLILTHIRPDGDTLGCAAGLCAALRKAGKNAALLPNPGVTSTYADYVAPYLAPEGYSHDTVVSVDIATTGLFPDNARAYAGCVDLAIDHHPSYEGFSRESCVDHTLAACGELIYAICLELGQMDSEIALPLYVAVSTDTGCFRYSNTDHHTFLVAAACSRFGARVYELNQQLFETNTLGRLKMQAWIVENLRPIREGRMAVVAIPRQVEQDIGVTDDDMDNISSFPRTIAGIEAAATLREGADGEIKLSVRTIPGYDATKVAERFGGGGHKAAAGANIRLPLAQAAAEVEKAMLEL